MSERVLMKGNEAMAEAAIRAGCRHLRRLFLLGPISLRLTLRTPMKKNYHEITVFFGCFDGFQ